MDVTHLSLLMFEGLVMTFALSSVPIFYGRDRDNVLPREVPKHKPYANLAENGETRDRLKKIRTYSPPEATTIRWIATTSNNYLM